MDIYEKMDLLFNKASKDADLKKAILATENSENALSDFCKLASEQGVEIYPMDIITESEASYDAIRRSTNGGGENSPVLVREDDAYETLLNRLRN
ncbi:MAG: hypothetical protein K6D02_00055 [Lachnospiraceae bacterium]|nr:hypothetical protein [Lachnospiraceae bacterium]